MLENPKSEPKILSEPAVAYQTTASKTSSSVEWNPNITHFASSIRKIRNIRKVRL